MNYVVAIMKGGRVTVPHRLDHAAAHALPFFIQLAVLAVEFQTDA
ncbi:hypothetical protein [Bradyrhizobium archetypum]|nr:hypothetical protein [Bradyrhizobium archetypum]